MAIEQDQIDALVKRAGGVLSQRIGVAAVYLFGSQTTGDVNESSDIDIAVFSPDVAEMGIIGRARLGTRVRMECHRDLEPHFFPAWALENPPRGSFAEYVIKTGKRII